MALDGKGADIAELSASEVAKDNMRTSIQHFRSFLGIGDPPDPQRQRWARNGDHNLLRVTRAIRSARLFGLEEEGKALYNAVMQVVLPCWFLIRENCHRINHNALHAQQPQVARDRGLSQVTQQFWTTAAQGEPTGQLQRRLTANESRSMFAALFGGN